MKEQAVEKLRSEFRSAKADKYGTVVKKPLLDVLCEFCQQDREFAQAVVQGGTFEQALAAAVRGAQNHTPDIQVYRQAVQFYFPRCDINLTMEIDLVGDANAGDGQPMAAPTDARQDMPRKKAVVLDLSDFM